MCSNRGVLIVVIGCPRAVLYIYGTTERLKSATIPFSRDPDFVNRENILDQIDQRCSEPAGRVALVGLGGVGKSQLAIEYAHRTAAKEPDRWVFWVHAGTQARVEEGFKAIADAVKLPGRRQPKADVPQLVYSWLSSERDRRWIVILDSADDIDVFFGAGSNPERRRLADYLPQSPNGSLLVTTRNKDLAYRLVGGYKNIIEIGTMAQSDALLLLERKLGLLSDKDSAEELVRALEYVLLAISQAAAYIQRRSPRSSVEKYLTEFSRGESKRAWLLGHDEGEFRREGGASSAILATWQISFEHIRSKRASAERRSDVQHDLGSNSSDDEIHNDEIHNDETDNGFEDNVAMLINYCLVTVSESGDTFEMHGLVQLSTRTWLKACGREEEFKHQFKPALVTRIAALFPPGDYNNWATCQRLFPHVERAVDYRPVEGKLEEAWATLLYNGGWYAELQGRYDVAEKMARKSRRSRKEILGREDERTLASTSLCAEVLRDKGLWKEAEKLNQGQWEEAEKLEVQVMETSKTKLGADHPDTLTSMANLASTFWNQGRWGEAEKLEVQVMETSKAKLGADHPDTLTSMANLAFTWNSQGRHEDALALMQDCVEARERVLGPEHPDTLSSLTTVSEWSS
ncbi:P-loop containing nucleoside triphosphate hydrolase protein [Pseudoneurospora amorphoporcata]|uniref:P-loop containing nucleoside triphosphate hydrolase protein n=1 Tax=Pseudoneurospora amorphoporcata TaxID=241081 RepID=A0AAN6NIU3_9PEZI|nr:P-loop containing nucleoside triphosphate hydrolase protein [Pseudoneurospora amorphoporcata]